MTTVKVSYGSETRRITLGSEESRGWSSFTGFVGTVKSLFPQLSNKNVSLVWFDEEGDKITVSSEAEFQEAVRFMKPSAAGKQLLRFEILPSSEGSSKGNASFEVVVHRGITCDECHMSPIRGIRYKCTVRDDYDLCESCEAKQVQPYPMVKIVNPSHAPATLIYAFRDQEERGQGGCPWRRGGCRRFGAPAAPCAAAAAAPAAAPQAAGPTGPACPTRPCQAQSEETPRWKARWDRRQERCGRRLNEAVAPFVAAFDKMVQNPSSIGTDGAGDVAKAFTEAVQGLSGVVAVALGSEDESPAAAPSTKEAQEALEEQLMQEALQESILLHEVSTAFAGVESNNVETSSTATAAAVAVATPAPAPAPVVSATPLPKPALRFINDVSFVDGTAVQPGASFRKVWRVRNDGTHAWPADVVLVSAGGDLMCTEDMKETLPVLAVGEERDIGVDLRAPSKPGLYTGYFRAQTKEKQFFGHRLWATVLVSEPPAVVPPVVPDVIVETVEEEWTNVGSSASSPVANEPVVATAAPASAAPAPAPATASPAPVQPLHLLWRKELAILADMGFVDADVNVPLLRRHLNDSPVVLRGDRDAVPDAQGMQRVITDLLTM